MKGNISLLIFLVSLVFLDQPARALNNPKVANSLSFIENKGQLRGTDGKPAPDVLFAGQLRGTKVYITNRGLTYVYSTPFDSRDTSHVRYERFDIELKNSSILQTNIRAEAPAREYYNFFYPHCSDGIYAVRSYQKITIKNVYAGIDFVLYGSEAGLKYDFIVHPGADVTAVSLVYRSLNTPIITGGRISLETSLGRFEDSEPVAFIQGSNKEVAVEYTLKEQQKKKLADHNYYETEIGFKVADYSNNETLILDPLQLWWGTYYGGTDDSEGNAITTDSSGNVFVVGNTEATNIPVAPLDSLSYFQGTYGGSVNGGWLGDLFLLKFTNNGQLLWATYFGGSANDKGVDIKCDKSGNVFVTGYTHSTDLPVKNPGGGAYFSGNNSSSNWIQEIFTSKFDNNGKYLWGTYYGTPDVDVASALAIDTAGSVYVTGATKSAAFPVFNPGGGAFYQGTYGGNGFDDVIILKFSNSGARLLATYFSGSKIDIPTSAASDPYGNVYFYGYSNSTDLFTLDPGNGAYYKDSLLNSSYNSFILKLNVSGQAVWSTYLGGSLGSHFTSAIACDALGNLFATGTSTEIDFPTVNPGGGAFYKPPNSGNVVFISKFDAKAKMVWSTLFGQGGGYGTNIIEITIGKCQEIYLSFPVQPGFYDTLQIKNPGNGIYYDGTYTGNYADIFLTSFTNEGVQTWGTFFGGVGHEGSMPLTTDKNGNLFYTGQQGSVYYQNASDFSTYTSTCIVNPGSGAYFQPLPLTPPGISAYCVVGKFLNQDITSSVSITGCSVTDSAIITLSGGFNPYTYAWSNGSTSNPLVNVQPGTYTCTIKDRFGCIQTETVTLGPPALVLSDTAKIICEGSAITLSAQGAATYQWQPVTGLSATTGSSVAASPTASITYTVTGYTSFNCSASQLITLTVNPKPTLLVAGNDSLCAGDSSQLLATGAITYVWQPNTGLNSATSGTVIASPASTQVYTVSGTDLNNCADTTTFLLNVYSLAQLQVIGSLASCIGQGTQLTATGADNYQWTPVTGLSTSTGSVVTANPATTSTYTLIGTMAGMCTDSIPFTVTVNPLPTLTVTAADSACEGQEVGLNAQGNGTFAWWPSGGLSCVQCPSPIASIYSNTQFIATITDENSCTNTDSVTIAVISGCGDNIIVPNVFTPNSDDINDVFLIKVENVRSVSCEIYDRWGLKVFESTDPYIAWDGHTTAGLMCVEGTYYYLIEVIKFNNEKKILKGFLTLVN